MLHPLQFAAMYKNLCTLEENALSNETPVEMVSVDTDKGILQKDTVSAGEMMRTHRSVLKHHFRPRFRRRQPKFIIAAQSLFGIC